MGEEIFQSIGYERLFVSVVKSFEALRWLKTHNTKYYGHITIDLDCIRQLPEDDVPPEILGVIRQTTDMGLVDQESAGYVPMDNDERAGKR